MTYQVTKRTLTVIALLSAACSGHDIMLATGGTGGAGAGPGAGPGAGEGGLGQPQPGNITPEAGSSSITGGGTGGEGTVTPPPGWIAFDANPGGAGRHIRITAADGSCQDSLTDGANQEKQPAFSHDGKQLAFASDASGKYQIYVLDLAGNTQTQLTSIEQGATYPSWSTDGASIAFVTGDPEGDGNASSAVMLVDTTTQVTRSILPAKQPPWTWSAFASSNLLLVGNEMSLIGVNTDTLTQYDIVPFNGRLPEPQSPSVSPDGTLLTFSDYCGEQELYVARVDGRTGDTCANAFPLASYGTGLIAASWGPNGYIAAETHDHDIVVLAADGSPGTRTLAGTASAERNPAYAPAAFDFTCVNK